MMVVLMQKLCNFVIMRYYVFQNDIEFVRNLILSSVLIVFAAVLMMIGSGQAVKGCMCIRYCKL